MIPLTTITADWVQKIIRADQELFLLLNKGYTNSFFDAVFPVVRLDDLGVSLFIVFLFDDSLNKFIIISNLESILDKISI